MKYRMTGLSGLLILACSSTTSAKSPEKCSLSPAFNHEMTHLEGYRLFVGPDGDSAVAPLRIDARIIPLFKTGKKLGILDLPKSGPRQPQIFVGPPGVELPLRSPSYKEMFILLSGSLTLKTAKVSIPMKAGSVLFFDDVGAKKGHGATIGPCGYVSLSIAP